MSKGKLINKFAKNKIPRISSLEICGFNSKLFIDLDSTYEQSLKDSFSRESVLDDKDIIENNFLIKELIEELDSPKIDSLIDIKLNKGKSILVNNGYEFITKKYRYNMGQNSFGKMNKLNNNKKYISENNFSINKNVRKGDWVCKLCLNVNFSFRKKCNRCKILKEKCIQKN
jgi:hypothetical protein